MAKPGAARPARAEWQRGWRVVMASAFGIGTGAALYQYVSSLFVVPVQGAFGWSRGEIATGAAIGLIGSLVAPLTGHLADRFGVRRVAPLSIIALALAFVGMSMMNGSYWQFVLCSFIIGLAAPGTTGLVYTRIINGWFDSAKGQALGIMASGVSLGALLLTPVVGWAIATWGFRGGYLALAVLTLSIALPAVLLGVRPAPTDVVPADLDDAEDAAVEAVGEGAPPLVATPELVATAAALDAVAQTSTSWRAALRTRGFWLLALGMVLVNAPSTGILTQLDPLLAGKGVSASMIALYIALFSISVLVGRIGVGMLFDRLNARRVAAVVTLTGALGALLLTAPAPALAIPLAIIFVGLLQGSETDVLAWFVSRLFGQADYSAIYGALMLASLLGTATGVVGFGRLYDYSQNYDIALIGAAVMLVGAAITYALLPTTDRRA